VFLPIGGSEGIGRAWQPSRFKRAYANSAEDSLPYLAPHDVFQYLPDQTERLSLARTKAIDRYRLTPGQILQTCSGRNLGPNVLVDEYLARFVASHDIIRIEIAELRLRHYTVAFLRSAIGQELLRRDRGGSVIDHITVDHVAGLEVPILDQDVIDRAAELIARSSALIGAARLELSGALTAYEGRLPSIPRPSPAGSGWTVRAASLRGRLDAASYDPRVAHLREELRSLGGVPVAEVADVLKPPGRYKTIYVEAEHGRPFMSGTQILQLVPARRQYMAERAFRDPATYELRAGWSVFMADGRAEKDLGVVAMIPSDRDGWLASGHVGRLIPAAGTDPGWLWLAARTRQAQVQLKALASGSVVDSTYPADMERVILPPPTGVDGEAITAAWEAFAEARMAEQEAISLVDAAILRLTD
jgi:hypothetical protein